MIANEGENMFLFRIYLFCRQEIIMSNLFSYFQRIEPKKMAATTADSETTSQTNKTPKNDKNGVMKKNQTPKESSSSARKSVNMSDVYSADSPKSEKRKKSPPMPADDHDNLPKNKKRKTLNARNESDDDDEPQLKVSKVKQRIQRIAKYQIHVLESKSKTYCHSRQ